MDSNTAPQTQNQESKIATSNQQSTIQPEPSHPVAKINRFSKILIALFVVIIVTMLGVILYKYHKTNKDNQITSITQVPLSHISTIHPTRISTITPTPTEAQTSLMSMYTNTQYGFQLQYPSKGFILSDTNSYSVGSCGQHIKVDRNVNGSNTDEIDIDNFFGISIVKFTGTLDDYIKQDYPSDRYKYIYTSIQGSNADEAVSVSIPSNQIPNDEPIAIYQKGAMIFTLFPFKNEGVLNACVPDNTPTFQQDQWPGLTGQKYTNIYNTYYKNWNILQSFKFI